MDVTDVVVLIIGPVYVAHQTFGGTLPKIPKEQRKEVEINFAYQDEKIDHFDIDSFGIDNLDVDPKDQNDTTHLNVSDFLTNEGRMSSVKFEMNYDNTNDDPHTNEYELEVQGTIIPDLIKARHAW
ncbi:hypothetical protein Tco_0466438 [Tanacetum coccineum]